MMHRSALMAGLVCLTVGALLAQPASRPADSSPVAAARPWLVDATADVGLSFTHVSGARGDYLLPEIIGAGVALVDIDNDGDLDIYVVQSGAIAGATGPPATAATSRLWRNDLVVSPDGTRHLRFTDVTDAAGVGAIGYGMGVATGDIDGDGFMDLYVTALGRNTLFRNRGDGTFDDITDRAGVGDDRWSTSAAFVDIDGDGHLDLFVTNYLTFSVATNKPCFESAGIRDYCTPTRYQPVPDRLWRNRGDGTFADITQAAGIDRAFGNGLGVAIGDYDRDGHPDIYVANDATPNQLWRNLGDGRFEDEGPLSGAAFNSLGRPEGSMGIASGDYDHDGDEDLIVTNIIAETFALYDNDGAGGFDDRRREAGLAAPTATMTGFGVALVDLDNDGVSDLVIANGGVNLVPALRGTPNPYRQRNQLFQGQRSGDGSVRFEERTGEAAGRAFEPLEVSRGLAVGDLDNDGFADVVISNNQGPVRVLRNTATSGHAWVGLVLQQPGPNPFAIGATVTLDAGPAAGRLFRVRTDDSYLSASDVRVRIGLGGHASPVQATITWPDGVRERTAPLAPGRYHTVRRSAPPASSR